MLATVRGLHRGPWFRHFVFGVLDRDGAIRFMSVHNRQYMRIVADILAAQECVQPE
jgi:hypothetical protein